MKLERGEIMGIVGLLVHTMDLDAKAGQDEMLFVNRFLERVGIPLEARAGLIEEARAVSGFEEHVRAIESRRARLYAMQQVLLLALSDGEYRQLERAALQRLAESLCIEDVLFEELESWAIEGAGWQIRGAALLAR